MRSTAHTWTNIATRTQSGATTARNTNVDTVLYTEPIITAVVDNTTGVSALLAGSYS